MNHEGFSGHTRLKIPHLMHGRNHRTLHIGKTKASEALWRKLFDPVRQHFEKVLIIMFLEIAFQLQLTIA